METFNLDFPVKNTWDKSNQMLGYSKCMQQLYNYLLKTTEMNPAKRFIDAVPLLDIIGDLNGKLSLQLEAASKELEQELEPHEADLVINNKLS